MTLLTGLYDGRNKRNHEWTEDEYALEFARWIDEIRVCTELSDHEKAVQIYAVKTLKQLSCPLGSMVCHSARHNAVRLFVFFCAMVQWNNCTPHSWPMLPNLGGDTSMQITQASEKAMRERCKHDCSQ